jgi:hypothetical protein
VHRPPPGYRRLLEPVPVPNRSRGGYRAKKKMPEDLKHEVKQNHRIVDINNGILELKIICYMIHNL